MADSSLNDEVVRLERQVLGTVLLFKVAARFRDAGLREEFFYRAAHRVIWKACEEILDAGADPDHVMVRAHLAAAGQLEQVGKVYLGQLDAEVSGRPNETQVLWFVAKLTEFWSDRCLTAAEQRFRDAHQHNPDAVVDGTLDAFIEELDSLRLSHAPTAPWLDPAAQWKALTDDAARRREGSVLLGLGAIDEQLEGVCAGEVCGLMARPGIGKTVLLCHQARVAAMCEQPHVFFSLEMPAAQIAMRLVQAEYALSRRQVFERLEVGALNPSHYAEKFRRFRIVDKPGLSVEQMSQRLRRIQQREFPDQPIRVVTIDHTGLIGGDERLSTYDRVSRQLRSIKDLAKDHKVAVILAVQVNRDKGGDGSQQLDLGSARDSGVVEEALDYLIGWRRFDRSKTLPEDVRKRYRDVLFGLVVKSRHMSPPDDEFAFRFDHTLNLEPAPGFGVPEAVAEERVANFGSRRR